MSSLYEVLKGEVETGTGTQKQIEDKITSLQDQLGRVTEDLRSFDIKLGDIGRQQHKLAKQQEEFCIETKQAFAEVKEKQGQTNDRLEELTNTNAHKYSNPLDEGKIDIHSIDSLYSTNSVNVYVPSENQQFRYNIARGR